MSGPTGYEAGGARTLLKTTVYTVENAPPGNYPAPDNVFSGPRNTAGVHTSGGGTTEFGYTFVGIDGETYTVIRPTWGGPGKIITPPEGV